MPSGLVFPAHSGIGRQFLCGRSDSGPSTGFFTRRRGLGPREPAHYAARLDLERLLPADRIDPCCARGATA